MLFLLGAAFGFHVRRGGSLFPGRTFAWAAVAQALVGVGVPLLAYLHHPAWMWGYYVDPSRASTVVVVAVFALYWVPFLVGFAAPRALERWKPGASWIAFAIGMAAQAGLLWWQWPRYQTVTSLEGFRLGERIMPSELPLLRWSAPVGAAVAAALWWIARPRRVDEGAGR